MSAEPDGSGPVPPRSPAWGCLAAVIICAIGLIVGVILVARLANGALTGVRIR